MNASAISKLFSTSPALEILDLGENYLPRDPIVLLAMFSQPKKLKQLNGINPIILRPKESIFSLGRQRIWYSSLIKLLSKVKCSKFGK
jgi:hypothetical protein